jgi:hypothetical protein
MAQLLIREFTGRFVHRFDVTISTSLDLSPCAKNQGPPQACGHNFKTLRKSFECSYTATGKTNLDFSKTIQWIYGIAIENQCGTHATL